MNEKPEDIFRSCGGVLRMSEAIARGITRYTLYSLREKGVIEQVSRGTYRMVELPPISNPDLVTVGLRFPNAVICLVSALTYHEITTQIPHSVSVAVLRKSRLPSLDYPPLLVHRFSNQAYHTGIEQHQIDGISVKIYSPEKTLADCFKFRNEIGMDVVLEALKLCAGPCKGSQFICNGLCNLAGIGSYAVHEDYWRGLKLVGLIIFGSSICLFGGLR